MEKIILTGNDNVETTKIGDETYYTFKSEDGGDTITLPQAVESLVVVREGMLQEAIEVIKFYANENNAIRECLTKDDSLCENFETKKAQEFLKKWGIEK